MTGAIGLWAGCGWAIDAIRLDSCSNFDRKEASVPPAHALRHASVRRHVKHCASGKAMQSMLPQSQRSIKALHRAEQAHTWVDLLSAHPLGALESYIGLHQHVMAVAGIR